ncbi:glutamate decarboxylase 1-like [Ptychodera flava]|uniref:glutamate decarboxylase 1-like n=1 Tax=Ptychodera flava TaxID=63121 RepID=UPI00396A077B
MGDVCTSCLCLDYEMESEKNVVLITNELRNGKMSLNGTANVHQSNIYQNDSNECHHIDPSRSNKSDFVSLYAKDLLPKGSGEITEQFLLNLVDQLINYIKQEQVHDSKILDFHQPQELRDKLQLDIPDKAVSLEQLLTDCRETLKFCVRTGHPRFFNQLSSGLDILSMAGEWLTAAVNTNIFTYEIAPVFTLMERVTLKKMRDIIGFEDGDGIFAPGGAISNLYAVNAARHKTAPECKTRGMQALPRLVLFASEHSHYSLRGAAATLGIGTDNVIPIRCDERGKMMPADLVRKIQQAKARGDTPFFVSATAGTTVLGAFDPLQSIADICEKYKIWMHVDAAWGGGALLSKKHKTLLEGIERADSVTWNPHKLMGVLLQCSALLLKHDGLLESCNAMNAGYLFQQDKNYDVSYDSGDKAIQCGRHVDVFKLWLMWRGKGNSGLEMQINTVYDLAKYFYEKIKDREDFEMVLDEPEFMNVCFWYIPPSLQKMTDEREKMRRLHRVAPIIKARMMECGSTMVGYQPLGDKVNFFRLIISNPAATCSDLDFLIAEIVRLGNDL